ncbi:RNA methyltransferase [Methylobrevis pamukkalensis]|uniref:tRNA (cytidine/uridine-2'-O-)-methyltransferase TrmJ n=1 Tax=Methylobrevis pamukkalensis TaxID=1439726 RepID=A0A1E3H4D5_9HYPH|nr:RNA methyltransferase [Methylobrevis pamukkalensis]ODN70381.1 tRNA (cytidine/uridine-2'-O-)-methyltransferase TrmJ [Methylobrevis pamukkalensis]
MNKHRRDDVTTRQDETRPVIILVEPQLGENIGTAARAMANFGLRDLRLVTPRDGWPNEKAVAAASRADHVIAATRVYDDLASAVADLNFVYATTARDRDLTKPVAGPVEAAAHMRGLEAGGGRVGILFGRERWGLNNDEISLADEILTLPVDPEFASLNIAQAVLVIAYEWRKAGFAEADGGVPFRAPERAPPATKDELVGFFEHLEGALDAAGFLRPVEKRPAMVRNLRAIFQKASLNAQEVRTLRGVVAGLERRHERPRDAKGNKPATAARSSSEDGGDGHD